MTSACFSQTVCTVRLLTRRRPADAAHSTDAERQGDNGTLSATAHSTKNVVSRLGCMLHVVHADFPSDLRGPNHLQRESTLKLMGLVAI